MVAEYREFPASISSAPEINSACRSDNLSSAFLPNCVAVVGASATRGKWSNDVFRLLQESFKGTLVPVNPVRETVEGVKTFPSISAVTCKIDYAIVVVARDMVLPVVQECVAAKIPVVHILSAGFGEVPGPGVELQRQLLDAVQGSETVLIGPNSMGLYSARAGLSFAWGCHFEPGSTAFVSQSGSLCYDVLFKGQARGLSFGTILSVGNCSDLDWPDYVRYFASDPQTEVLALYIESVTDGRRLFEELQAAAKLKPIVVLKGGKTQRGSQSVVSHTGRLAGEYDLWRAMLRQAGAIEVASLEELLVAVEALKPSRWAAAGTSLGAPDTMIIGTGGGATVLIADACESAGIDMATIGGDTVDAFGHIVPDASSLGGVGNPLDIGADRLLSDSGLLGKLVEIGCRDEKVGIVLVHLNLIAVANNLSGGVEAWIATCKQLAEAVCGDKLVCLVLRNGDGGARPDELQRVALDELCGTPLSVFTDMAEAICFLQHVRSRMDVPARTSVKPPDAHEQNSEAGQMLASADARAIVEKYGITLAPWAIADTIDAALMAARDLTYPVALKTAANDIAHKSDADCVRLNLATPQALRTAFAEIAHNARKAGSVTPDLMLVERMQKGVAEIVIGLKRSSSFGATILVGMGGIWVEVMRDFVLRLCPVDQAEAFEMLGELRGLPALTGGRGRPPGDLDALAEMIVAASRLGASREDLFELDLNPVMLMERGSGAVAVDARVVLRP